MPSRPETTIRGNRIMAKHNYVTRDRLNELLSYDPYTGIWTWKVSRGKRKARAVAGHLDGEGYIQIQIDGIRYAAHNLAFLAMLGRWPTPECDHRDVNPSNNKWTNLREASRAQNAANRRLSKANKSGFMGVRKRGNIWEAVTNAGGRFRYLGCFPSPEQAHDAYAKAVIDLFGEYARIR